MTAKPGHIAGDTRQPAASATGSATAAGIAVLTASRAAPIAVSAPMRSGKNRLTAGGSSTLLTPMAAKAKRRLHGGPPASHGAATANTAKQMGAWVPSDPMPTLVRGTWTATESNTGERDATAVRGFSASRTMPNGARRPPARGLRAGRELTVQPYSGPT